MKKAKRIKSNSPSPTSCLPPTPRRATATPQPPAATLRQEVETGLGQVGYHQDEIQAVVKRLFAPEEVANEENPQSQTDLACGSRARRVWATTAVNKNPRTRTEPRTRSRCKLNAAEKQMLERLKTVPFGTWFEFAHQSAGRHACGAS